MIRLVQTVTALVFILACALPARAQPPATSANDTKQTPTYDTSYVERRFSLHRLEYDSSPARMAWLVLREVVQSDHGFSTFSSADRPLLKSIADLQLGEEQRGLRVIGPALDEMCALPEHDVVGRARLMNKAVREESGALDEAITSLLAQLTPAGQDRVDALVRADTKVPSTELATDWERIAIDLPDFFQALARDGCVNYRTLKKQVTP